MPSYTVILNVSQNGAAVGSTNDVIEAESADEAERKAIEAWKVARPACSFTPLFTREEV